MIFRYPVYKRMYEAKVPVCMYMAKGKPWYCKTCVYMFVHVVEVAAALKNKTKKK